MSKLSFRARALDAARPLPVYRRAELPQLTDCGFISRAVPQMPSGMDKDEELEHHLQRAMSAQQVFRERKENMVIPVPEAESNSTYYDRLYKGQVKVPKQLIHVQPLSLDLEQPDYDMDSEDETLLNRLNRKMDMKPLQFEIMVDRLEKASTHQEVSLAEAKRLLNEDDYLLKSVYDYWLRKRRNRCLIFQVKQENRDGSTNHHAYVAFRRRTEKMTTRKNRKNDEASYEKMLRLRREFSRTVTILEMIKKREKSKRELLHLTLEVVEKRYQLSDFNGDVLKTVALPLEEKAVYCAPVNVNNSSRHKTNVKAKMQKNQVSMREELTFDPTRPKNRCTKWERLFPPQRFPGRLPRAESIYRADVNQYDFHSSGEDEGNSTMVAQTPPTSDDENYPDGVFIFRRTDGCLYLSPRWDGGHVDIQPLHERHFLTKLSLSPDWMGLSRRRTGRGGRILLDRASCSLDSLLNQLDTYPGSWTRSRTVYPNEPVDLDQKLLMNSSSIPSLSQALKNIQTLRRCCFRPRPIQNQRITDSRTAGPSVEDRRFLDTPGSGGITEEQYYSHQQQLMKMKKQQLEQLQYNEAMSRATAPLDHQRNQSHRSPESTSRTLDSVSAHFAASAVVSTSPSAQDALRPPKTTGVPNCPGASRSSYSTSSSVSGVGLLSIPKQQSQVGAVYPTHHHNIRPSAPPPSALKLATLAAKVIPVSGLPRDIDEPDRQLNGLSENTQPMEVT
ncbi:enhancer of polycomb homolog 2 isoform X2 [Sphaeramia orbicularis]|uniref:enhancer of polycomb homolog 2 isoform X2 n=1 Tax=Sphaeramia orbicularis TaxID=375764 RepID=UPI00117FEF2B|nr:enhancer of polycomb homolog 2 isoform X2 [Sphaeramia orbicularis]